MRVSKLWDRHAGEDVYVLGTAASSRVFPLDLLRCRTVIGLNEAWRYWPVTYSLTVHPELYKTFLSEQKRPATQWVVKKKPPMADLEFDDPELYVFKTSEDFSCVRLRVDDTLYIGKGIHCTAMSLAAHMGAKNVFMVGCDACTLSGEHHGHDQHVRYHGLDPEAVFEEYRRFGAKVRKVLRTELGVNVVTLSPFVGVGHAEEDYNRLCLEHGLPRLPKPKDTSPYKRKRPSK